MKILLENVTKVFPGAQKSLPGVTAVRDFTLEFPDGALIGLLGPSGCGKSTTLHLISGLQKPTDGKIYFGDEDVTDIPAERRGVGLVFQNYALYPHLTVLKNITFPLENLKGADKLSREEMTRRATEAARLVQIDALLDRKPGALSGGQQQRVAIARAIVKLPKVLLLDEPLSNLDARLRLETREELRRIQRATGITTVFVTHDQEEAMSISDLIVVMKNGEIEQVGKPQDIYDDPDSLFVAKFLGTPQINVFEGEIQGEKIYIGSEAVGAAPGIGDMQVYLAIRPEGFMPDDAGSLTLDYTALQVMGRDVSMICRSDSSISGEIRAIVPYEDAQNVAIGVSKFNINPAKLLIFDRQTEKRIYISSGESVEAIAKAASEFSKEGLLSEEK